MDNLTEKIEKSSFASVAIDGGRIKAIREAKKLTQLYVASVVGVTTDTISRWENNRYPTIRRDNAEKLATALEVELEQILRLEVAVAEEEAPPPEAPPPIRANTRRRIALTAVVLVVVGLTAFFSALIGMLGVSARRRLATTSGTRKPKLLEATRPAPPLTVIVPLPEATTAVALLELTTTELGPPTSRLPLPDIAWIAWPSIE